MKSIETQVTEQFPEFVAEVAALGVDALDARLAQLAKDADAVEVAKEEDEEYQEARSTSTALGEPYRDSKKAIKLRSKYLIQLIKEKGGK